MKMYMASSFTTYPDIVCREITVLHADNPMVIRSSMQKCQPSKAIYVHAEKTGFFFLFKDGWGPS